MIGDYIIKEITAKSGCNLRWLHIEAMGAECLIADLEKGYRSLLRYKSEQDGEYHRLHTSQVLDIKTSDDGNDVTIETLNTVYHLVRNNFDNSTFNGMVSYTYEVAKKTVAEYFNEQDEQYFKYYGLTKGEVLSNDDVISRCATLHHNLIKEAGIDYAWACDFACANVLSKERASVKEY